MATVDEQVVTRHGWGRRLTELIRDALDAGDLCAARRLAFEGDGQARSLDKEYALMYRGLGITVRVLLRLLGETVARAGARRHSASGDAAALVRRFRRDMATLMLPTCAADETRGALDRLAHPAGRPGHLDVEAGRAAEALTIGETLFTREQARLAGEAVAAIDAGDAAGARRVLDVKETRHYVPLHDRLVRFMAETFGWVLERFGPDELLRFHRATAEAQRDGFEKWERMTADDFARATAFLVRQHMGSVEVREDAEKFTVDLRPCGSGGRLRLAGTYTGPAALPCVAGPGPLTFGEPRLPVYCTHCPVWNGIAPLEWFGRPHWVFESPSRPDGSCTVHIYKRHDGAPREYAQRLGVA